MATKRSRLLGYVRLAGIYALIGWLVWASQPTPVTFLLGLALVVPGEMVRFWAAGHLLKSKELVTAGPYAYTQNPLYLGRLLIYSGFCVMARFAWHSNLAVRAPGRAVLLGY